MARSVQIDVDVAAVLRRLDAVSGEQLVDALSGGLAQALDETAGEVVLDARSKGIESRTGTLLSSVRGALDADGALRGNVGVPEDSPARRYAYLLTDQVETIRPITADALTIPLARNLTAAGVPRYPTVAALRAAFGDDVVRIGRAIGVVTGKSFDAYFGLVSEVVVQGVNALAPTVDEQQPEMGSTIARRVAALIEGTDRGGSA